MQDNKSKIQPPDDDIIQSKADLRELLQSIGHRDIMKSHSEPAKNELGSNNVPASDLSRSREILLDAELLELIENTSSSDPKKTTNTVQKDIPDRVETAKEPPILSLVPEKKPQKEMPAVHTFHADESLDQSPKTQTSEFPDSNEPDQKLRLALQKAENLLLEKEQLLKRQHDRMTFLEQQLQNAVVLERAKSRYQQEVEKLTLQNQQLTAEITQLKSRLEDLYGTDIRIQQLQDELTSTKTSLSEQQTLTKQVKDAMGNLQNELASYKQKEHESQVRQSQHTQQIADMKANCEQLKKEHKQNVNQINVEHENTIRQKTADLEKKAAELADIRSNYQQLRGDLDQIRHEYEAFQTQANEEIRMLTESTDILTDENARLSDEIHQVQSQKQQLKTMLEKLQAGEANSAQLREELQQQRQSSEQLQQSYQQLEENIARTHHEKDELIKRIETLQTKEGQLKAEIEHLRETVIDTNDLHKKLQDNEQVLANLHKELQQERRLTEQLRQQYRQLETDSDIIHNEKDKLAEYANTLKSNEEHLKSRIEQLQDAAADYDVIQEKLFENQRRLEQLIEENASLQQRIYDLQTSAAADQSQEPELEPVFSSVESAEPLSTVTDIDSDADIPVFNLAEQIMEEHRRSVAGRRQRIKPSPTEQQPHSIKDVIGHFIPSSDRHTSSEQIQTDTSHHLWTDQSLTAFQREILREIVRKDMELGTDNKFSMMNYSSIHN